MKHSELLRSCEELLRSGKTQEVARRLHSLRTNEIPRDLRRSLANLCRRAGLLNFGLKVLAPAVRESSHRAQPAEKAEYGALLYRVGAIAEALNLLESVDSREAPEALLFQAFCYFSQWEYAESLPILDMYLRAPISKYAALVGCVNLCAALVGTRRFHEARELLNSNLELTRHGEYWRLHGNCLELSAQVHIQQGDYAKARLDLDRAAHLLPENHTNDELYIRKWRAILHAFEKNDLQPLMEFRTEAVEKENWESVREADLFALKFDFSEERFEHLIFGTPFLPYRDRVMLELSKKPARAYYIYGDAKAPTLDLASGVIQGITAELKPGTLVHRVTEALLRDLYRPMSMGALFGTLFPGEYFDPYSSPNRLHQMISRTRSWFEEQAVPVHIDSSESGYRLRIAGSFAFRLPLEHTPISRYHLQWEKISRQFANEHFFTAQEGRTHLGVAPSSFKRLMRWALDQNLAEKRGGGSNVLYKLKSAA